MKFRCGFLRYCVALAAVLAAFSVYSGRILAQETLSIRIGGTGNYGPVLPVIAAQELGLFKKAGVDAQFTNFSGGSASMEGLAAGEVDLINYFPPGLALARQRGVEATIVGAGTLTPRGWAIMVKRDSDITDLKQLIGKTIGITANGSTTDFFALWAAKQAGGDFVRVPVGGGALIPSLMNGNVVAISGYPPLTYKLELSGDGRILVDLGRAMEPNLPDVWIASDKIIKENPEAVRRGLVGLYSAVQYMKANREWTIKFIQERTGASEEIAKKEFENTILGLSDAGELKEEWVAASLNLGTLAGLKDLPAARDIYTDRFVPVQTIKP